MKYLSKVFQPLIITPKNAIIKSQEITSKSQRLMMDLGVIRPSSGTGLFTFLPMGTRVINKLTKIVDAKLSAIDAQKISLPILVPEDLWMKSKRLQLAGSELMILKDRHNKHFVLGPTHEESITDLIAAISPISPKNLPIRLYQIGDKFRDEMRPRYGTIRSREFLMKDLYTFDIDEDSALATYELVNKTYEEIFRTIGINFIKVEGSTGMIGGSLSHEYHCPASIGEDVLFECSSCDHRTTHELLTDKFKEFDESLLNCPKCDKGTMKRSLGIEVGHAFLLGTRYSNPFEARSVGSRPLHMGCYGLGLSRIVGAVVEMLSSEHELRWPSALAPYSICLIGPKRGSKEESAISQYVEELYSSLVQGCHLFDDIIIDDRSSMTIGKRVLEAKRFGYPYIVIVGQNAIGDDPEFELIDVVNDATDILSKDALIDKIKIAISARKVSNLNFYENYSVSNDLLNENSLK